MSKKDTKSFKVPRIKRVESKDNLRQVDVTSRDCLEIVNSVKRSYLASDYESPWQLKTAALVENRELEAVYRAKKADLKEEGRHARDLTDHFAFVVQRDNTIVPHVVKDGLKCKFIHQNNLGDSKLGVYVCRNADVQLKYAEGWKVPTCTLMIFKIVLGKCKSLVQQVNDEKIEPTPNYDCHIPQVQARPSDNFSVQLARSQVYLYEYTDDCEPSVRPRQVLPYAILTYEKAENIPCSLLSSKVDSYSKRPTSMPRSSDVDTTKSSLQTIMNRRDPRLNQAKVRPGEIDGGLCVPRLTPGPPPKEPYTAIPSSANDLGDPRSQLSFLTPSSKPAYTDNLYQPSFGPGSEEQQQPGQNDENEPQEPLTSLPPLNLPRMPSPNSQLDTRYTDPRFGYVDLNINDPPSESAYVSNDSRLRTNASSFSSLDPRLRQNDPRVQSVQSDPRTSQMPLDPRRQQRPMDPRLQQQSFDPRLNSADPRVQKQSINDVQQADKDDKTKTRKKLSLSDYKKKVNISKPVITKELAESIDEIDSTSSTSSGTQSLTQSLHSGSVISNETDPTLEDKDYRLNPSGESSSTGITCENNKRLPDEDFVEEPDDMAKTLNELSDPDDMSQSPKQLDGNVDEVEVKAPQTDDPMLSEAMQKLVEHSGNVSLFTEALRLLQESAEQFGDQLTDPEFLVKKIAEKIDELSNSAQKVEDLDQQSASDIADVIEIDSPEMIKSPDLSTESKTDEITPVKHIPLENVDIDTSKSLECVDMEISDPESDEEQSESKLDLAMQKTLEELAKVEQSQCIGTNPQTNNEFSSIERPKMDHQQDSSCIHLLDIPIPKGPPAQLKQDFKTTQQTKSTLMNTKVVLNNKIESDDEDDEMKVSQILPSLQEKKKATISINLKMNQKAKLKPPVPDIFKDDVDLRVKEKGNIGLNFSQDDKDFRIFPVQQKQSNNLNKINVKKPEKSKKGTVLFDSGKLDIDNRKKSISERKSKFSDTESSEKKMSEIEFPDPFGLGTQDVDHRKVSEPDSLLKKETNDYGDIDWRTASDVADVDMRSTDTSNENSQSSNLGDFDLRHSHSRSASPTSRTVNSDGEKAKYNKAPKFVDPFGLDEDIDERVMSRSNSPLLSGKGKSLRTTDVIHDSNSGSGILFDAYSLRKSEFSNEFGDIDWRQAAAAEMGDVDMRSVSVEKPLPANNLEQRPVISCTTPVIIPNNSIHSADPFQQMNKNLQNMFNINQSLPAYQTSVSTYDSYQTSMSDSSQPYGQYRTSKNEVLEEYRTSQTSNKYLPTYTTSESQQNSCNQGGIHNIMQNLDFSNLKNILATVKQPGSSSNSVASPARDQEEVDKPAFVTGLSSVNSKPGLSKVYGSNAKQTSSPMKCVNTGESSDNKSESVSHANRIPGFDVSPEKEEADFHKTAPSKENQDSSSFEMAKTNDNASSNFKEKDAAKKENIKTDSEDNVKPVPDMSYQAAILESMEETALKVRHDDDYTSEPDKSPRKFSKRQRKKKKNCKDESNSLKKRRKVTDEDGSSIGEVKQDQEKNRDYDDGNKDEDDDDDESGLVIDLDMMSPVVKHSSDKDSQRVKDVQKEDIVDITEMKEMNEPAVDLTEDDEPVLVIADDSDEGDNKSDDLQAEDTLQAKTKDEMTSMIEISRKNMVIRLKGETKLVNPKTGKAYNESPKGSAIEVLGKSTSSKDSSIQQIHPIHGIVSVNQGNTLKSHSNSDQTNYVKGQPIYAIGTTKPSISTASEVSTDVEDIITGSGPQKQQNQTSVPGNSISSVYSDQAPISNIIGTNVPTINQVQAKHLEYIHPVTGQKVVYGRLSQSQPGLSSTMSQPIPPPQPVPPPVVQSLVPHQVLPGQGSHGPFLPTNFNQQRPDLNIPVMSGNIVGQQTKCSPMEVKSSTDVFDCFRDKYEKRNVKNETTNNQSYILGTASETKMAYSVKMFLEEIENKAKKELNVQANARTINTIIKREPVVKNTNDNLPKSESIDIYNQKRPGDGESNIIPVKKIKSEFDAKTKSQNDFGSRILESLTEVKNKLRSPEKVSQSHETQKKITKDEIKTEVKAQKDEEKKEITESGASSELEDGEISEDSHSESEEPKLETESQMQDISVGASIPVLGSRPGQFQRIPTVGSWQQSPFNGGNNISTRQITTIRSDKQNGSAFNIGADWADIIQNPETRTLERVKATKIESPSLHSISNENKDDTASLVSKSAASISKSRQKNKAQSQVKTLGEWLKLELEIDNIEPLQNIIPYALDTDLTKIPKQRKRRIRMKVKNAIEQEGTKASSLERQDTVTVEVLLNDQPAETSVNSRVCYSPEVSNEQTERELKLVGSSLNFLREKVKQQTAVSGLGNAVQSHGEFGQFLPRSIAGSVEDKKMIVAMTLVESEMRTHLGRTCFYGYPHRRVPDELLLSSEIGGFKSEAEEVFLILMMPLSTKPYNKLLQLKKNLCDLYERRKSLHNPTEIIKVDEEIRHFHNQRQALLRGFTGYLNKKRIQKLQETVDKYTLVYDYFRSKTPSTPDSMLRFIRTTQIDLRQHLILAKQYLALEAQKMQ